MENIVENKDISENEVSVEVKDVSIRFNLGREKIDTLKEFAIKFVKGKVKYDEFWALKTVNFSINKGDRLGILGLNGAGKSTLLKIIAGVLKPTFGTVYVKGTIAPLLELGAGFESQYTARENIFLYGAMLGYSQPDFTGRENIYFNASIFGLTKEQIDERLQKIIDFSELRDTIDVPIKNYSSGMRSRLGFAICTAIQPDILILDEVLSVGDAKFRKKCEERIQSMFDKGVTVLFVSHSLDQGKKICNKALILDHGRLEAFGNVEEISAQYSKIIA